MPVHFVCLPSYDFFISLNLKLSFIFYVYIYYNISGDCIFVQLSFNLTAVHLKYSIFQYMKANQLSPPLDTIKAADIFLILFNEVFFGCQNYILLYWENDCLLEWSCPLGFLYRWFFFRQLKKQRLSKIDSWQ